MPKRPRGVPLASSSLPDTLIAPLSPVIPLGSTMSSSPLSSVKLTSSSLVANLSPRCKQAQGRSPPSTPRSRRRSSSQRLSDVVDVTEMSDERDTRIPRKRKSTVRLAFVYGHTECLMTFLQVSIVFCSHANTILRHTNFTEIHCVYEALGVFDIPMHLLAKE